MGKKSLYIVMGIIIALVLLLAISGSNLINNSNLLNRGKAIGEADTKISSIVYNNKDINDIKVLIIVEDTRGIEYVEQNDNTQISGNGKTTMTLDYSVKLDDTIMLTVKPIGGVAKTETILINQERINNQVELYISDSSVDASTGTISATVNVNYIVPKNIGTISYWNGTEYTLCDGRIPVTQSSGSLMLRMIDKSNNELYTTNEYDLYKLSFIGFSDITWENGKASITITKNASELETNEQVEYCVVGSNSMDWTLLPSSETLTNLSHSDYILARIIDEAGPKGSMVLKNILDQNAPNIIKVDVGVADFIYIDQFVYPEIEVEDLETGIDFNKSKSNESKYLFHKDKIIANENEAMYTGELSGTITGQNITALISQPGKYYVHVMIKDLAGNIAYGVSDSTIDVCKDIVTVEQVNNNLNKYIGQTVINEKEGGIGEWYILGATSTNITLMSKTIAQYVTMSSVISKNSSGATLWMAYLNNPNNWTAYSDNVTGADYALGAPKGTEVDLLLRQKRL